MLFVIALICIALVNVTVAQYRISYNLARDSRRLKLSLKTELSELILFQYSNVERLQKGDAFILSMRAASQVYRGNLQRLILMSEPEIQAVVKAYAICEQAEHFIAAVTKQHGAMTYKIVENETRVEDVIGELERSRAAIRQALDVIDRPAPNTKVIA